MVCLYSFQYQHHYYRHLVWYCSVNHHLDLHWCVAVDHWDSHRWIEMQPYWKVRYQIDDPIWNNLADARRTATKLIWSLSKSLNLIQYCFHRPKWSNLLSQALALHNPELPKSALSLCMSILLRFLTNFISELSQRVVLRPTTNSFGSSTNYYLALMLICEYRRFHPCCKLFVQTPPLRCLFLHHFLSEMELDSLWIFAPYHLVTPLYDLIIDDFSDWLRIESCEDWHFD